ncbi:hypothetical protein TIFTF001_019774 [Ficus carica]|uniref:non-specific serine/threonine protein kinase n=1 Tax=Ficus carica TaxID=3494 RepID=A0AA88AH04_FICCA|nr:hypothetical protein TIFTF001_019774 [Ficus carica]
MLYGNFPVSLWTSLNMTYLTLSNNTFTGVLPKKLGSNLWILDIGNNRFSGKIPTGVFSWKNLRVFRASNNLLTGTIPHELFTLPRLIQLFLNQNQLTGDLPSNVESLKSLYTLDLSRNQLTGQVLEKLAILPILSYLDLSENKFSGKIPSQLGYLVIDYLNLSSNNFAGVIPLEFENTAYSNSFLNNPSLCSSNRVLKLKPCNPKSQDLKFNSAQLLALITSASVAVLLLALSFVFFVITRGHRRKQKVDLQWQLTTFQRLNFTESNVLPGLNDHNLIGSGGSGIVYRIPVNDQGDIVAVKRIWNNRKVEHRLEQEFLSEVKILSSIQHANIVKLFCCISSESSKLLVYEYLENQSLDRWLHNKSRQTAVSAPDSAHQIVLNWPRRLRVAVGVARGLCYMHHDCLPPVLHRDIKSSNILLDSDFNPKIADFGLAKMLAKQGEVATMSSIAGTFGYIAPGQLLSFILSFLLEDICVILFYFVPEL